jgi:hypothetical protein
MCSAFDWLNWFYWFDWFDWFDWLGHSTFRLLDPLILPAVCGAGFDFVFNALRFPRSVSAN